MHSTKYTELAFLADAMFADVVAVIDRPSDPDCHDAAWCILRHEGAVYTYSCHMVVFSDTPHLTWGHYSMNAQDAFDLYIERANADLQRALTGVSLNHR